MDTMANEYLERTPWTELRLEAVRDLVDPQPGDRVLDLGCAAGAITHYLSTFGAEPVGIDFEPLAIAKRARALSRVRVRGRRRDGAPLRRRELRQGRRRRLRRAHRRRRLPRDVRRAAARARSRRDVRDVRAEPAPPDRADEGARLRARAEPDAHRPARRRPHDAACSSRAASASCAASGGRASSAASARSRRSPARGSTCSATASACSRRRVASADGVIRRTALAAAHVRTAASEARQSNRPPPSTYQPPTEPS